MKHRGIIRLALLSTLASFIGLPPATIKAQQVLRSPENAVVRPTPPAASAATAVPALVPYSGYGTNADGKPITGEVPVTFLLYKDETGGEPVFTESQVAAFDPAGHYEVQLGATLSNGISIDLFGSGEARWLEVQIAGARIAPRALLASVPYALKAGDASTLGGLPASAYALAGSGNPPSTAGIAAGWWHERRCQCNHDRRRSRLPSGLQWRCDRCRFLSLPEFHRHRDRRHSKLRLQAGCERRFHPAWGSKASEHRQCHNIRRDQLVRAQPECERLQHPEPRCRVPGLLSPG